MRGVQGECSIIQVANGTYHSVLIAENGQLYACGLSRFSGHMTVASEDNDDQP